MGLSGLDLHENVSLPSHGDLIYLLIQDVLDLPQPR